MISRRGAPGLTQAGFGGVLETRDGGIVFLGGLGACGDSGGDFGMSIDETDSCIDRSLLLGIPTSSFFATVLLLYDFLTVVDGLNCGDFYFLSLSVVFII
jgi:hypothetical protein